jgi:O-antigen/teichoic acid export membrane protein
MIMGMNFFVGVGLFLKNQTKYYLIPSFSAVAVNIAMNFWLIPIYGMMGAAYSVVTAQVIYTSLLAFLSGKQLKIDFEWSKILLIYILAILLFGLVYYLAIQNFWMDALVKLIILSIFPIVLYKLNFFEQIEIQRAKEGVLKFIAKYRK